MLGFYEGSAHPYEASSLSTDPPLQPQFIYLFIIMFSFARDVAQLVEYLSSLQEALSFLPKPSALGRWKQRGQKLVVTLRLRGECEVRLDCVGQCL